MTENSNGAAPGGFSPSGRLIRAETARRVNDIDAYIQRVRDEATTLRTRAEQDYQAGYERGRQEGRAAGEAEASRLLIDTRLKVDRYLHRMERELAELLLTGIDRVLGGFDRRDLADRAIRQALSQMQEQHQLRLIVASDRVDEVRRLLAEMSQAEGSALRATVEADSRLAVDECVIASEIGFVNAGLAAQLAVLRQAIRDAAQADGR